MDVAVHQGLVAIEQRLLLILHLLQLLVLQLQGLLVRQILLDIGDAHVVLVLIQIEVILNYISLQLLLG